MLKKKYQAALKALKKQAKAADMMFPDNNKDGKLLLAEAHKEMNDFQFECKHIVDLVRSSDERDITIVTLSKNKLERMLGA